MHHSLTRKTVWLLSLAVLFGTIASALRSRLPVWTASRPFRMATFASSSGTVVSDTLLRQVNAWCGVHGLMYTDGNITWTPAPLALTPTPYPKEAFDYVRSIQPLWNTLMDRIARDREFLLAELSAVSHADPFTQRVLELFASLPEAAVRDTLQLAILRSDYMLDYYAAEGAEGVRPLQVEINTISSSFGSLSHKAQRFHRDLLLRHGHHAQLQALLQQIDPSEAAQSAAAVAARHEDNASLPTIAAALAAAHDAYLAAHHTARLAADRAALNRDVVVLFVVQACERNQGDQRALEQALWDAHGVRAEFATLGEIAQLQVPPPATAADGNDAPRPLLLRRPEDAASVEVSVAYYRAGYTPQDYAGEAEWAARRHVEASAAVKCPSAGYHLAGAKAVQAALCKPGAVERFFPDDPQAAALLRRCFAAQFSLGDASVKPQATEAIAAAIADRGARWVLKPQREGGGNNFYGEELARFLETHAADPALDGYVLMQRIFPRTQLTAFYRQGRVALAPSISELGVYGTFLSRGPRPADVLVNRYAGYLLRTKAEGVDEGGVATGYSVLNSIYLV